MIYTVVICFLLYKLLQCASWSWSHPGVKVLTTSSALLLFCVEDKIQGDLGVGEVGLGNFLGLAARSGRGFGTVCPSSHIQPSPLQSSDSQTEVLMPQEVLLPGGTS